VQSYSADYTHKTEGTFDFDPYWTGNKLEVHVNGTTACEGAEIVVTNQWDQMANHTFSYEN